MRSNLAPALAALVVAGALTACTSPPEPDATATPTATAAPSPTATTEVRLVGAGEKPPVVFGGDCAAALTPADIREVTGVELASAASESRGDLGNVGGLLCSWEATEGTAVRLEILPRAGLGDTRFPADQVGYYFEECDAQWVCAGVAESDDIWIGASFQSFPGADRAQIDEWTASLTSSVFENLRARGSEVWTRDRSGWWTALDCTALAATMSGELGTPMTGEAGGYHDPPPPGGLLAATVSNRSGCYLYDGGNRFEVNAVAGQAWMLPTNADDPPFDTGVPGVTAWLDSSFQSVAAAGYTMTDGVNALSAVVSTTAPWSAEDAVRALARGAASDWG
ncbi:hypothetical protein [Microbacterium atlanticum]|uniref:hypothetical protein n=1 Tax=Microbacterium atlanticum TaxID=2782168 RepID=UPI0018876A07|nr:hypothetical protein [Microbacterium atlanticum]